METIWKYSLNKHNSVTHLTMPYNAIILCVQLQHGIPTLWALVDKDEEMTKVRHISIYGTGWELSDKVGMYIGTYQDEGFVWHVFEEC